MRDFGWKERRDGDGHFIAFPSLVEGRKGYKLEPTTIAMI
jgi:hypothetical protein